MRKLLGILIILAVFWGIKELIGYWDQVQKRQQALENRGVEEKQAPPATAVLPGLPPYLESSLQAATRQGARGLKVWLKQNRHLVQDPRLADIELDYVVLVAGSNFSEAREVFAAVKQRTPANSPVYPKIRKLAPNYE